MSKRYQLYSHYQDENEKSLGIQYAFDWWDKAYEEADKLAKNPIAYGTVKVYDNNESKFIYIGGSAPRPVQAPPYNISRDIPTQVLPAELAFLMAFRLERPHSDHLDKEYAKILRRYGEALQNGQTT